jgi:hypothetical protein
MKYPWPAAIAILLSAGAANIANAMTYKDIAGRWCGDVTDYVFTPNTLTVKFHNGRPPNMFKITKYTYTNTACVLIGSMVPTKSRSRFSRNLPVTLPPWRSSRTATSRADLSIAAESAQLHEPVALSHVSRSIIASTTCSCSASAAAEPSLVGSAYTSSFSSNSGFDHDEQNASRAAR